jgi:hypothetical protein
MRINTLRLSFHTNKMILEILQIRLIKVWVCLAICLLFKNNDTKLCSCCGCELDIEDYFLNNLCEYCGSSQGFDKEYFDNSNLNYCKRVLLK